MALESVGAVRTLAAFPAATGVTASLRNGQVLNATITSISANGTARLDTGSGSFEARLAGDLRAGSTLQLQVQRNGQEVRLVLLEPAKPGLSAPATSPAALNFAGALQAAIGSQHSLAPLLANLAAVVGNPDVRLPAAVHTALEQLVAFHLPGDGSLDAEQLRTAVLNSGLLYEAKLAMGSNAPSLGADMKGVLLVLQNGLRAWLGTTPTGRLAGGRPAPPLKGAGTLQPGGSALPSDLSQLPPKDIGQFLLAQTEAALARLRLTQIASLPGDPETATGRSDKPAHELTFELPFAVGERTVVVQFKLSREGAKRTGEPDDGWSLRFSLDAEPLGPVHGAVVLRQEKVSVTLWAEGGEAAEMLRGGLSSLRQTLDGPAFDIGELQVLTGSPERSVFSAGTVVDRVT